MSSPTVIAAVALRGSDFIAEVKRRSDVKRYEIIHRNWDELPAQIFDGSRSTPARSLRKATRGWEITSVTSNEIVEPEWMEDIDEDDEEFDVGGLLRGSPGDFHVPIHRFGK